MKIDFNTPITDLAGEEFVEKGEVLTLKSVAINALLATLTHSVSKQPEDLTAEQKVRNAKLAQDIYSAPAALEISVENVAMLKERIGKAYAPLVVMKAWEILDPTE